MEKTNLFARIYDLYADGFRNMTLGKTLWLIIFIKLFIIFGILKVFFFPDFLKQKAPNGEKATYVSEQLVDRAAGQE